MFKSLCFPTLGLCITLLTANISWGDMLYTSASFGNRNILVNNATTYQVEADITEGGIFVGTLTATATYGGGTNPFASHNWTTGLSFLAYGNSAHDDENSETAEGFWEFEITPAAGFQVDGLTLFTENTHLANPTFENLVSNGTATVWDDNQGLGNELLANFDNGDSIANGSDLIFNTGAIGHGISNTDHSEKWSYDSEGATSLSFTYKAGPVEAIGLEGIRFDAALSAISVPEPSSIAVFSSLALCAAIRRRRR